MLATHPNADCAQVLPFRRRGERGLTSLFLPKIGDGILAEDGNVVKLPISCCGFLAPQA
jgi:hypothetical protein